MHALYADKSKAVSWHLLPASLLDVVKMQHMLCVHHLARVGHQASSELWADRRLDHLRRLLPLEHWLLTPTAQLPTYAVDNSAVDSSKEPGLHTCLLFTMQREQQQQCA